MPGSPSIQDFLNGTPPVLIPSATEPVQQYTPSKKRRRLPWFKIGAAGIFLLLLVVGAAAAVVLTQRNQESRSRASIGQYPEVIVSQTATSPGSFDVALDATTMPTGTTLSTMKVTVLIQPAGAGGYSTPVPANLDTGKLSSPLPYNRPSDSGAGGATLPGYPVENVGQVQGVSTEIAQAPTNVTDQDFPTLDNTVTPVQPVAPMIAPDGGTVSSEPIPAENTNSIRYDGLIYCDTYGFTGCPSGQTCFQPPTPVCKEGENCINVVARAYCRGTTSTPLPQVTPIPDTKICDPRRPTCPAGYSCVANTSPGVKQCDSLGNCVYGDPAPGFCVKNDLATPTPPVPTPAAIAETIVYDNKSGVKMYVPAELLSSLQFSDTESDQNPDGSVKLTFTMKVTGQALQDGKLFQGKLKFARIALAPSVNQNRVAGGQQIASVVAQSIMGYRPGSSVIAELYEPNLPKPTIQPTARPTIGPTSQPTSEPVIACGPNGSCPAGYSCVTPQPPQSDCVEKPGVRCPQLMPAMPRCVKNPEPTVKPAYDLSKCWSLVTTSGTGNTMKYFWPTSCKGIVGGSTTLCKATKIALTSAEIIQYKAWVKAGKPALASCRVSRPTPVPSPSLRPTIKPTAYPTIRPTTQPTPKPIGYDPSKCWSRVVTQNGTYFWPDGCRGVITEGLACAQAMGPLSSTEIAQYKAWISAGKPALASCSVQPTSRPTIAPTPTVAPKPSTTTTPVWRRIIPWIRPSQPTPVPVVTPRATSTPRPWYYSIFSRR